MTVGDRQQNVSTKREKLKQKAHRALDGTHSELLLETRRSLKDIRGAGGTVSGLLYNITPPTNGVYLFPVYVVHSSNPGNTVTVTHHHFPDRPPLDADRQAHHNAEASMLDRCFRMEAADVVCGVEAPDLGQ